ncbi:peroxidase family protein [Tessaracoccus sp. MC1756]|uniref:peroxidase family protein n=1 Tax=Tessaracoccus sp. MC1756 TaxID=2760311 RepID=UPI00160420E6|nr:cell wall-binding repeat-containing protein [Tessaracoccus sp. MC1756]
MQISEAHAADLLNPSSYELLCPGQDDVAQNCVSDIARPRGVRTVDGSYNNLTVSQDRWGSSQEVFPRLLPAEWRQADAQPTGEGWPPNSAGVTDACETGVTCYEQTDGFVYDAEPRMISNLIVDQTTGNPAIVNQVENGTAEVIPGTDRVITPNTAPDEGLSAPFNSFLSFFGQFFDHGLDLVSKGGNGTLVVPLAEDDDLYCLPSGVNKLGDECDPRVNFLVLTRATRHENGTEHINLTTPFIDQNQTYSSNPSHQVFLREYQLVDGRPMATGRLLEGVNGGMAKWRDLQAQAANILGIRLTDAHVLGIPQVHVDPYGNFIPGSNGFPQLVTESGLVQGTTAGGGLAIPANYVNTGQAFLDDIAHGATPVIDAEGNLQPRFDENGDPVLDGNGEPVLTGYDNAALGEHFMAGDGRVNENIGLTAVHTVFHAEHNRLMRHIEQVLNGERPELLAQDAEQRGGIAEFAKAFRGEEHAYVSHKPEENLPQPQADDWSYEERLFQAAKFANEMQYQHLVFEEFGRKIAPTIDGVVFNENSYDARRSPSISAEFAHVVYRFGHSMMTEEIGRKPVKGGDQTLADVPLLDGFLNPGLFDHNGTLTPEEAAGSLINGMTEIAGSQIDEHVVDTLRNNLLGLPLDLPTINLLRGRDTGVPPLQRARQVFFEDTGEAALEPYSSWEDFGLGIKNGNNFGRGGSKASLVNFVAAYGTHETITSQTTVEGRRAAAALLVNGAPAGAEFIVRHGGENRFQTAQAIALNHFTGPVPVVYITAGYNFPDALAGGTIAGANNSPILLAGTVDGVIPIPTLLSLIELQPQRIVVLGGTDRVGAATMAALDEVFPTDPAVQRIAGSNRFHTAELLAQQVTPGGPVYIANGWKFPDALSGSAVAAATGDALLLTNETSIPVETQRALERLNPSKIYVLGSNGTVSDGVASQLAGYTSGDVVRLGGNDRYETSVLISQERYGAGADRIYVAIGDRFPDALTASPVAGLNGAPLLLVPASGLTPVIRAEIERLNPSQIHILGSPGAVTAETEAQLAEYAPVQIEAPADRLDFMNSTGLYESVDGETVTGLENVDMWVGGLAERLDPFGGMLGSTFNHVFELQLEALQFGDRFYYLFRNEGEQLFAALEGNTFSDLIQRNTDASHLPADIFALQDPIIDVTELDPTNPAGLPAGLLRDTDGTWRWSGDEHVELHGTPANDLLRGDEGDDSIWGYAGDDRIEGGAGDDALVGGPGDDIITDSFGNDNIKGMQGNDYLHSGPGIDLVLGGLGDDFMINGPGEGNVFFAGMGDDIVTSSGGRFTGVIGGEHDDWVEGGPHADLLQGDNADQFQNDTLGGNDVVAGRLGNDDIEGEGGHDVLIGAGVGTDRHHGGNGFDWLTYYGQTTGVTSDWAFNRFFEPNNPLPSRFDFLEALSGGAGDDTLKGPLTEADDLAPSEIELSKMTQEALDLVDGLEEMLRPTIMHDGQPLALGDFTLPMWRDAPEIDMDGVHKVVIGGPGSDEITGRGGNDYLDGDAMLRVRLKAPGANGGPDRYFDTALQMQALVRSGEINPGDIDIIRDIVYDDSTAVDTAVYENAFAAYTISPIGPLGSGYWTVTHTQVDEGEESDGTDVLRGFERLQFADGCAELAEDGVTWESCLPTAEVTMDTDSPVEGQPVTALLWEVGGTEPFDTSNVTNLRYTWWAGEGDTPDAIGEWEAIVNPLTSTSNVFVPTQAEVGQFLMVTASYTDADGLFRTATSAVSANPVADLSSPGTLAPLAHPDPLVLPQTLLAGVPSDPDGLAEDQILQYQWSWSATDPSDEANPPQWVDFDVTVRLDAENSSFALNSTDAGRWIRVAVTYQDGGGETSTVYAHTSVPLSGSPE